MKNQNQKNPKSSNPMNPAAPASTSAQSSSAAETSVSLKGQPVDQAVLLAALQSMHEDRRREDDLRQEERRREDDLRQEERRREDDLRLKAQEERRREDDLRFKAQEERMMAHEERMLKMFDSIINSDPEGKAQLGRLSAGSEERDTRRLDQKKYSLLVSRLPCFEHDPDSPFDFAVWFNRHKHVIENEAEDFEEEVKVRMILEKLGSKTFELYRKYKRPEDVWKVGLDDTVKQLTVLFATQLSRNTSRMLCLNLCYNRSDSLAEYTGKLNELFDVADFDELKNEGLKCLLWIFGMKSPKDVKFRHHLLSFLDKRQKNNEACTVQQLHQEGERFLLEQKEREVMVKESFAVNEIVNTKQNGRPKSKHWKNEFSSSSASKQISSGRKTLVCFNCKKEGHSSQRCTSELIVCRKCNKRGHLDEFCDGLQAWRKKKNHQKNRQMNMVEVVEKSDTMIQNVRKFVKLTVNGLVVEFQADTGSDTTVLNVEDWKRIGKPQLNRTDTVLRNASGEMMEVLGEIEVDFATSHTQGCHGIAFVVKTKNLMGLSWMKQCDHMNHHLDQMVAHIEVPVMDVLKEKYREVFAPGLGKCVKSKVLLPLKAGVSPKFCPKRSVPFAAVSVIEAELDRLITMGVIEPVSHSEWAAPIVAVKKANGNLRVCADFSTGLNEALDDVEYPLPTPEALFASLNGGTVFSTIDFSDAYLQVELAEEAKRLVVVNTHKGLFRYNRLPFGIKTAPAMFQQLMDTMISGLKGTVAYLDDVLVMGRTKEEHDSNLIAVFERIAEYGFRVRLEKCHFGMNKIRFLGYELDRDGRKPLKEKLDPIVNMPAPKNESQLRSFLGMIAYYGAFIRNLTVLRGPLDKLTQKDVKFVWTSVEQTAFDRMKGILMSDLNVCHYDPNLPVVVSADASEYGIGAVLSHVMPNGQRKPIAHASRTLQPAERKYAQIEKEALGLVFALKKFHRFVYGRKFVLETDHKPLLAIFGSKKGIPVHSANRLIRWSVFLLGYDFEIQYINTLKFGNADCLSRLIPDRSTLEEEDVVVAAIEADVRSHLNEQLKMLPVTEHQVRTETSKDPILSRVMKAVKTDKWNAKNIDLFKIRKDSLAVVNGCILMQHRVVVPEIFRKKMLKELHIGHQGMVRMKSLARSFVYWPGIDKDVESLVSECEKCRENAKSPVKVPLQPWPKTSRVYERVHLDFCGPIDGYYYLAITDAFSKWPEMIRMPNISATATVKELEEKFSAFGFPELIVTDNGTQFVSESFEDMCKRGGISHIRTPAYHPMSNGQAERFVDTLKRALKKSRIGVIKPETVNEVLMAYRATPSAVLNGKSPAEMFLGRKIRTRLSLILPKFRETRICGDQKMKDQFDRRHGVRDRDFKEGEGVYTGVQQSNKLKWLKGVILKKLGSVNYLVKLSSGRVMKRHTNQLNRRIESTESSNGMLNQDLYEFINCFDLEVPVAEQNMNTASSETQSSQPQPLPMPMPTQPIADANAGANANLPRRSTRTRNQPDRYIASW